MLAVFASMVAYSYSRSLSAALNWIGQITMSAGYSCSDRPFTATKRSYSLKRMAALPSC